MYSSCLDENQQPRIEVNNHINLIVHSIHFFITLERSIYIK